MTVIDVGANLGYYSLLASSLVGPTGKVVALEPNSENCRLLLSSIRLNGITNVELIPVACDHTTGWAYYSTHVGSNGGLIEPEDLLAHPGIVVATFRLDDLVEGPVGLLKMDVEGAEGRVVAGATRVIESSRPIVTTELTRDMLRRVSAESISDYLGYFENLGYRLIVLEPSTGEEVPYPTVDALLEAWGGQNRLRDVLLVPSEIG
jgi:FkbM family methyltransferase